MPGAAASVPAPIPVLSSVPVSAVILVLGIVLFVVLCYKGVHTATSALDRIRSGGPGQHRRIYHHHHGDLGVRCGSV